MLEPQQHSSGGALDFPGFNPDDESDFYEESIEAKPAVPWWRRRRTVVLIAVALLVLLAGGGLAAVLSNRAPSVTYLSAQVAQGNLAVTVSATGPVQSATYAANFATSGTIAEIDVKVGQQVKAGQVLAKLDPSALQEALNQAQIQAYLAYDQEQQALARCAQPNPPVDCVQQAENQYALALAQLQAAKDNLAKATLKAPHAGTVVAINGSVGSAASSGGSGSGNGSASSGFIEIVDLSSLQVAASVNEADIGKVSAGQTATFTVSAYTGHRFRGSISTISYLGQTTSNVVTYPVTIQVDMSTLQGDSLLPGMTANVTITTAQRSGVLLLPASAVTFARSGVSSGLVTRSAVLAAVQQAGQMLSSAQQSDPTARQDNLTASFVLERTNDKWVVKPVVLGLTNGSFYEVLAGLSEGDAVVTGQQGGTTTAARTPGAGGGGGFFPGGGGGGGRGGGFGGGGNP
jgi:HlyD family secretion protein